MPKLKTHRGAAKRFKKTGTGKFVRGKAFKRHILTSKTTKAKRHMRGTTWSSDAGRAEARADAAVQIGSESGVRIQDQASGTSRRRHRIPSPDPDLQRKEISNAASQTRNRSAGQAEEAARPRQGLLPDQEQAVSRRERGGRHGAEVRVRRPQATRSATSAACGSSASTRPRARTGSPTRS